MTFFLIILLFVAVNYCFNNNRAKQKKKSRSIIFHLFSIEPKTMPISIYYNMQLIKFEILPITINVK